jgi:toxin ParE1/3/4
MRLRWSKTAREDLKQIARYIARDNPKAARRWIERLRQRALSAASQPRGGRVVPEYGQEEVREVFERTYRIIYEITSNSIYVLTVLEGHHLLHAGRTVEE